MTPIQHTPDGSPSINKSDLDSPVKLAFEFKDKNIIYRTAPPDPMAGSNDGQGLPCWGEMRHAMRGPNKGLLGALPARTRYPAYSTGVIVILTNDKWSINMIRTTGELIKMDGSELFVGPK